MVSPYKDEELNPCAASPLKKGEWIFIEKKDDFRAAINGYGSVVSVFCENKSSRKYKEYIGHESEHISSYWYAIGDSIESAMFEFKNEKEKSKPTSS